MYRIMVMKSLEWYGLRFWWRINYDNRIYRVSYRELGCRNSAQTVLCNGRKKHHAT
jgi:hypothetical protein